MFRGVVGETFGGGTVVLAGGDERDEELEVVVDVEEVEEEEFEGGCGTTFVCLVLDLLDTAGNGTTVTS